MRKSVFLRCILACSCFGLAAACGDDGGDDGAAGSGGGAAGNTAGSTPSGGTGGTGAVVAGMDPDPRNPDCPMLVQPLEGEYALKGKCCYRRSNTARLAAMTGDTAVYEFKASLFATANHPKTAGNAVILTIAYDRFDKEEQVLLFRFTLPRKDGKLASGPGQIQIGSGRYNCDGTYSYYSDKAAPVTKNFTNPARWNVPVNPATVDMSKPPGQQITANWATNANRNASNLPYIATMVDASGNKVLEWETVSRGFTITQWPDFESSVDCAGSRGPTAWVPGAKTVSFVALAENNKDQILGSLMNISLAQLFSFGTIGAKKDEPQFNDFTGARCMPGDASCIWVKLPDSLCPSTPDEESKWRCHVGYTGNPDNAPVKCTPTAPTTVLDPDMGATTEGQCCDPLAKGTGGLPACNAFRVESDIVASAVEITDQPAEKLQENCIK